MSLNKSLDHHCYNVIVVGKSIFMKDILKSTLFGDRYEIYEASDEIGAIRLILQYNPKIVFVSIEDNHFWTSLVQTLKRGRQCTVVGYSTGITREDVARAYFAGVDDILVNPQEQKERIGKYIRERGVGDRCHRFPDNKPLAGYSHWEKFFWLQAE